MTDRASNSVSPIRVVVFAWIIPGGGYFLIGQRTRAIVAGISIIALFLCGILIGGIRIMDPPGWGQFGFKDEMIQQYDRQHDAYLVDAKRIEPSSEDQAQNPRENPNDRIVGSAIIIQPVAELSDKPWFVGQILVGPLTLAASALSVDLAKPTANLAVPKEGVAMSHSRSWEIGALYTAVAGMLNLLAIIDSTYRAGTRD